MLNYTVQCEKVVDTANIQLKIVHLQYKVYSTVKQGRIDDFERPVHKASWVGQIYQTLI